jgi:GT2 family glycosyltransferase
MSELPTARASASVIVVAYNSRADLPPCIESILPQLGAEDELIVVDNGSSDGGAELVVERYPRARLLRGPNTGYAGGNNRAAAAAQGKYLVFLNPDTVLFPGALAALLAPLERERDVALSTARIVHKERPGVVNACGNTVHYTGLAYCRGAGQPAARFSADADVDAVSGAAFAIRRELFAALGSFDERFFMYVEDTDLSWRARLAGYRCRCAAGAVVAHDYRPSYSPAKAFYLDRNRHLMLMKNLGRATYLRLLPGLALAEALTWGFLMLKGPRYWGVKPRVYGWMWAQRAEILAARRQAQARRTAGDGALLGRLTYRLEFEQLAGRTLAGLAAAVFHPAFWAARLVFVAN